MRTSRADEDDLDALGALAEPHRRALYEFVVGARRWVSREEAAAATDLGRSIASHHLDRMADDGLLEVDYQRQHGRRGPGAGRPAKVYRRASHEVAVHLPPRDYELAGRLLAAAADTARIEGTAIDTALDAAARAAGAELGAAARARVARPRPGAVRRAVVEELDARGFEPEDEPDRVVLHNCPFHQLAQAHTELICGMNLCLFEGLLDAVGATGLCARLEPVTGQCCVQLVGGARS